MSVDALNDWPQNWLRYPSLDHCTYPPITHHHVMHKAYYLIILFLVIPNLSRWCCCCCCCCCCSCMLLLLLLIDDDSPPTHTTSNPDLTILNHLWIILSSTILTNFLLHDFRIHLFSFERNKSFCYLDKNGHLSAL